MFPNKLIDFFDMISIKKVLRINHGNQIRFNELTLRNDQ